MLIIGFCGKMQSGKTTCADTIVSTFDAVKLSFAYAVKKIAVDGFGWDCEKDARGRRLLQVIGTEAGRAYDEDIWVNKIRERVKQLPNDTIIVIDDLRFDNEAKYVKDSGGLVIQVTRPRMIKKWLKDLFSITHASEISIDKRLIDITIKNISTKYSFKLLVISKVREFKRGVHE